MRRRERVLPGATMYEGRARGGPRDGVKLTAGLLWDGRISKKGVDGRKLEAWHPGHYEWDFKKETWVWHEGSQDDRAKHRRKPERKVL